MVSPMYLSVEVIRSLLWQLSYVHTTVLRTLRVDGSFITCPTPSRIVSSLSALGYSGVCTEVWTLQRDPLQELKQASGAS